MELQKLRKAAPGWLMIGLTMAMVGCASSGYKKGEQTASFLQSSASEIENAGMQLDVTGATLNDLVNNPAPDLRPQFKKFSAAVGKRDSLATSIRKADENMQTRGTIYFSNWDQELAAIQNEGIRARGQTRKLEVFGQYDGVRNSCLKAQTDYSPLLSDLQDIHRFLDADLTPGGLAAIKDATAQVNLLAAPVHESVSKLVSEMRALGAAMSPQNITK